MCVTNNLIKIAKIGTVLNLWAPRIRGENVYMLHAVTKLKMTITVPFRLIYWCESVKQFSVA